MGQGGVMRTEPRLEPAWSWQEEATYIQEITTADGQTVQHLVTSDNQVSTSASSTHPPPASRPLFEEPPLPGSVPAAAIMNGGCPWSPALSSSL